MNLVLYTIVSINQIMKNIHIANQGSHCESRFARRKFMTSLKIEAIKEFMSELLSGELFDKFLISEVKVRTFVTTTINGDSIYWKQVRPMVFELIKGRQTPSCFIVLMAHKFENGNTGRMRIQYESEELRIITSYNSIEFTMKKTSEYEWDDSCKKFLKNNKIPYFEEK